MTDPSSPPGRRLIFRAAGLPMLLVDPETILIEDVNDALVRFYERTREELVGHSLGVLTRSSPERLRDAMQAASASGQTFAVEHVTGTGRPLSMTVTCAPVDLEGRHFVIGIFTERSAEEAARTALALLYEATSDIHGAIVRATSEAELWSEASRIIVEVAGFPLAWVSLVEPDGSTARVAAAAGEVGYLEGRVDDLAAAEPTPVARAIRDGVTVVLDDLGTGAVGPYREHAISSGFRSGAAVPMEDADGRQFGALVVLDRRPAAL